MVIYYYFWIFDAIKNKNKKETDNKMKTNLSKEILFIWLRILFHSQSARDTRRYGWKWRKTVECGGLTDAEKQGVGKSSKKAISTEQSKW